MERRNLQPSHPPAGQGRAHHATDCSFCVWLLKAPTSASQTAPGSTAEPGDSSQHWQLRGFARTHKVHTSLSFQHFIHLCSRTKHTIYFQTCSVSVFCELCLVLLFCRATAFMVHDPTASLLFANAPPRDVVLGKHLRGWGATPESAALTSRALSVHTFSFSHSSTTWNNILFLFLFSYDPKKGTMLW